MLLRVNFPKKINNTGKQMDNNPTLQVIKGSYCYRDKESCYSCWVPSSYCRRETLRSFNITSVEPFGCGHACAFAQIIGAQLCKEQTQTQAAERSPSLRPHASQQQQQSQMVAQWVVLMKWGRGDGFPALVFSNRQKHWTPAVTWETVHVTTDKVTVAQTHTHTYLQRYTSECP